MKNKCEKCTKGFRGGDRVIGVQTYDMKKENRTLAFYNCGECGTTYTKILKIKAKNWRRMEA